MAGIEVLPRTVSKPVSSLWLFLILAAGIFWLHGPQSRAQEYVFRPYRQIQGLENLSVNSLARDKQGFVWVATQNGVYRFLGSSFERFGSGEGGVTEQDVAQVVAAPDGILWIGGEKNLYQWTGQVFKAAAPKPILVTNDTSIAWESPGRLLVVSDRKLSRLRYDAEGRFLSYEKVFPQELIASHPSLAHIGSISALPDGTLWMACGQMLCSWGNGALTEWASEQGVPIDFYRSILQDHQGALWAVGQKHIVELPSTSDRPRRAFIDRSLSAAPGEGVYQRLPIACDPMGRIIVSLSGGIARWSGSSWQAIGRPNGLISTHLTAFLFDGSGNLWLGSSGHGLHHWIGYADWEGWTDRQGLPSSNIWSIGPLDGDRILVGTEHGPAIIDARSGIVTLPSTRTWIYGQVTGMIAPPGESTSGSYLISTASGALVKMEGHPARTTLVADLQHYIYGLLRDSSGRTFAIAGRGIFDVSALAKAGAARRQEKLYVAPETLSPLPETNALLGQRAWMLGGCSSPDGTLWFGSENGVLRLTRKANQDHWSRPQLQGLPTPLPSLTSLACAKDGSLWAVVGDSAIWHLAYEPIETAVVNRPMPATGRLTAVQLALPKALQTISAVQLFVDPRGWLWIGTDDGLLVWNGWMWQQLTQEDGLIWNDVNAGNMAGGPDGSIWVGTSGGLSRILHPEQIFATSPPLVWMIAARLDTKLLPLTGALEIPWSKQDLSFQFAAPNSLNRAGLIFFYRLLGLQSDWIESHEENAHFPTLPPGNYEFEVFARDRASGARGAKVECRFRVKPPWWRTIWFYALCGLGVVLGIVLILRLRTRHLLGQQRRLEKMVLERTSQLEASQRKLGYQATHDGLTGLLNRVAILEAFELELKRARRDATSLTLVLADIDHFKAVNDTHGHLAGDEAIRQFSAALADSIRPYDHVGRYGGEEFLLVLVGVDSSEIEGRLNVLHKTISGLRISHANVDFLITCSLGVAQLANCHHLTDQKLALVAADDALYEAKRAGRNRFMVTKLDGKNLSNQPQS